jgi:hypothetical protein
MLARDLSADVSKRLDGQIKAVAAIPGAASNSDLLAALIALDEARTHIDAFNEGLA